MTIAPGADAPSLDALAAIPGATVRYDEAARIVHHGDAPATIRVTLDAGPAWTLLSPTIVTLAPGGSAPVSIAIALAEGDADAGRAALRAEVLYAPSGIDTSKNAK